jgi:hypothetical protein
MGHLARLLGVLDGFGQSQRKGADVAKVEWTIGICRSDLATAAG